MSRNNGTRKAGKSNQKPNLKNKASTNITSTYNHKPKHHSGIPHQLRRVKETKGVFFTYVLDTNVILNAWDSIFKFEEHEVCIVSQVWKELDNHKKGHSDEAWNARKAIRIIDSLVAGKSSEQLTKDGVLLVPPAELINGKTHTGKLIFDFTTPVLPQGVAVDLSLDEPDHRIIMICLALKIRRKRVVLISNDGNCRVRAALAGIEAEEFLSDVPTNLIGEEDVVKGFHEMPDDFLNQQTVLKFKEENGKMTYTINHPSLLKKVNCNDFLILGDQKKLMVTKKINSNRLVAETFFNEMKLVQPRNLEQELAIKLLTDERIRGVSIAGLAGSGKTLLAISAGIYLCQEHKLYDRIIITRPTVGSDEDIGFLPGDETEKMSPWMGALYDNLEILSKTKEATSDNRQKNKSDPNKPTFEEMALKNLIQIKSLNFMKGRTFNRTFLIIDETQDLTAKKLKMISTRIGEGSKVVFLGNVAQIDDNYLTEHTCGMSVFIRAFADSEITGHITLQRGERSQFATEAEARL